MRRYSIILSFIFMIALSLICQAGIRGPWVLGAPPQKYCGVVVFDRWDGCTLYSGVCVMYIPEKEKERLRPYSGQAVQINARQVLQPVNPGDGLIRVFDYLGPAPQEGRDSAKIEGIHLASSVRIRQDGKPVATITIENTGQTPVDVHSGELALTLLATRKKTNYSLCASDGPSFALITRQSFFWDWPVWKDNNGAVNPKAYEWTIGKENALPEYFTLEPKEKRNIDILFTLPDGQYDFLCGYGGGCHESKCLASNLSAFDVKEGKATVTHIDNR